MTVRRQLAVAVVLAAAAAWLAVTLAGSRVAVGVFVVVLVASFVVPAQYRMMRGRRDDDRPRGSG